MTPISAAATRITANAIESVDNMSKRHLSTGSTQHTLIDDVIDHCSLCGAMLMQESAHKPRLGVARFLSEGRGIKDQRRCCMSYDAQ